MHIRIISGKYKARRITAPKNLPIRPTTDRAKESLFNILNNDYHFPQLKILDLFTGSGNIAYEFASRGAKQIHAVDANYHVIKFVTKTSKEFDFPIIAIKKDAVKFLEKTNHKYDIIFADPPYDIDKQVFDKILEQVFEKQLLEEDGLLILEHIKEHDFSTHNNFSYSRKYGLAVFSFFTTS